MRKIFSWTFVALLALNAIFISTGSALAQGQNGTTLSASKTATAHWTNTFAWTIDKSVSPAVWNLFSGDDGTSRYTVAVTKDSGVVQSYVDGQVCVTNGGSIATENLQVVDNLSLPPSQAVIASTNLDLSAKPVLQPGETFCYDYKLDIPAGSLVAGATYKDTANVTITDHSGHLGIAFGPSPSATSVLAGSPTLVNDSVDVSDTNGQSWLVTSTASVSYDKKFSCPADAGEHDNTATIVETSQSDSADVMVNCSVLNVSTSDPSHLSLDRKFHWSIAKSVDKSSSTLQIGEAFSAFYVVGVDATSTDSNWSATGTISIVNSSTVPASLLSVSDVVSVGINATVTCPIALPGTLPASSTLVCEYAVSLPDASTRLNTAMATIQNYSYDPSLAATTTVTSGFIGTSTLDFASSTINLIDESITVSDSMQGALGVVTAGVDALPKFFVYSRSIGPYSVCGNYEVLNVASFVTNDTAATGTASQDVIVDVPCNLGCTFTIGYWKNHAGFGPQADVLSQYLPIMLGSSVPKGINVNSATVATNVLKMSVYGTASNGITKLYAQLLAAKLNIASGASNTAVAATISAADSFLGANSYTQWSSLSKAQQSTVLGWMTALDNFNNGFTGPGHCAE